MIQAVGSIRGLCVMLLTALAAVALLAVPSGTAATHAPIPGVPGLPNIPSLPKPDQTAVFDVIVEGEQTDHNTSQLSGPASACLVTENGTVVETDTYLRGKDVKLEFDRYGHTIILKRNRGGQLGDTSLAVDVTVKRTAEGSITYMPTFPLVTCPPASDFSKNADCGKSKPVPGSAMVLGWTNGRFSLDVSRKTQTLKPVNRCGEDPDTGITNQLFYAWPHPAPLSAVQVIPARQIFDRRIHSFTVTMLSARGDRLPPHTVQWNSFGLKGTVTDIADNHATVRLIRQR